jgi:hypothetical protein
MTLHMFSACPERLKASKKSISSLDFSSDNLHIRASDFDENNEYKNEEPETYRAIF